MPVFSCCHRKRYQSSYCFYFFFTCLRDHPYLHSFPTRRSSDLARSEVRSQPLHYFRRRPQRGSFHPCSTPIDRKSTRLNSSHRCISYAVFCLKKKNQNAS